MKKVFTFALVALTMAAFMTGCKSDKFKTTKDGLKYRFITENPSGNQAQPGDVIVGEMTLKLDTVVLFSNEGNPDRILQVMAEGMFKGDIQEGLQMLHVGDKAIFAIEADSMARFFQESQMPPMYQRGAGQLFTYEISVSDIVTKEELAQEQANMMEQVQHNQEHEGEDLKAYIDANFPNAKPTASGLYIIVNKKGDGPKVAAGKTVSMDYTGRLLDGTIFDSSREADAKEAGKYNAQRPYEPMTYVVGQQPLIPGWDEGVMGQTEGSDITIVMPSSLGYGARGAGNDILPYSPLRFDITIVSVK